MFFHRLEVDTPLCPFELLMTHSRNYLAWTVTHYFDNFLFIFSLELSQTSCVTVTQRFPTVFK